MMGWIAEVANADKTGFWVNILAGIPYLFFDLLIITMLLPVTVRWWDERSWRATRLQAINHVLSRYVPPRFNQRQGRFIHELSDNAIPPDERLAMVHAFLQEYAVTMQNHAAIMDVEIQSALPVLNPEMTQDLLQFHYRFKEEFTEIIPREFISGDPLVPHPNLLVGFGSALATWDWFSYRITTLSGEAAQLWVKYAPTESEVYGRASFRRDIFWTDINMLYGIVKAMEPTKDELRIFGPNAVAEQRQLITDRWEARMASIRVRPYVYRSMVNNVLWPGDVSVGGAHLNLHYFHLSWRARLRRLWSSARSVEDDHSSYEP